MMSRTSVCAPKPTASPAIPAPVSTGAMSMPNSLSAISTAMLEIAIVATLADQRSQRARAFAAFERIEGRSLAHLVLEASHEEGDGRASSA